MNCSEKGGIGYEKKRQFDLTGFLPDQMAFRMLLCKQAAKNFHTICKKETALKRVLSNLLSAVSLLRFKAVFSCGFRVPPGSGLYQSCAAGSVCIPVQDLANPVQLIERHSVCHLVV